LSRPGAPPPYDPETVVVGAVGRPHGLSGELWVRLYNVGGEAFTDAASVILDRDGTRRSYDIEALRPAADAVLIKLVGVDDRDAAAKLTLSLVRVARSTLPPLDPGEFYVEDVVGCAVERDDGADLGTVVGTFWNGAHDVMTVVAADGRERMIPVVTEFVVAVDAPGRKIRVRWDDHD
jgi:16S rRNA processing protein RimM